MMKLLLENNRWLVQTKRGPIGFETFFSQKFLFFKLLSNWKLNTIILEIKIDTKMDHNNIKKDKGKERVYKRISSDLDQMILHPILTIQL